jgi:pantetheine-phosphate adenylyltransferase
LIRGIRAISDFEYEFQIALMNRKLVPEVATIFLMPHEKYTYLNSSIIRELSGLGQNVNEFVPDFVAKKLKEKFKNKNN